MAQDDKDDPVPSEQPQDTGRTFNGGPMSKDELISRLERAAKGRRRKYTPETGTSKPAGSNPSDGLQPPDHSSGLGF